MPEKTAVTAVVVKSKNRPALPVEYDEVAYELPGKIPAELITVRAEYKAPRNPSKEAQEAYNGEVGVAMLNKFIELVLPAELASAVDLEAANELFAAWAEHVGLGGQSDSAS
ncbi:hypothetical protein [Curtobacterium sp. MCSS17_015]|uniref:hypothetical protein n=1 Tax=Curtobacterium sp. MCSS17_015 TaxID=2175666 RepID=UPI000DA96435|nr:hypothetical protein [Curtobacterium sp. MCSS17_015]WIB25811.1 hypothetical protein DEJ18_12245 [Curtobacterium sp. MCSS17_015]